MVDVVAPTKTLRGEAADSRLKVLGRLQLSDRVFHHLTRAAAISVLLLVAGVIVALIVGSVPAFQAFGFSFLFEQRWNPVTEKFGALAPIYGTLVTSFIALLIAVPLGLLIAGPFSDWLGIRVWFWAGGILCSLIALSAFFVPTIMNIEAHRDAVPQPMIEPNLPG